MFREPLPRITLDSTWGVAAAVLPVAAFVAGAAEMTPVRRRPRRPAVRPRLLGPARHGRRRRRRRPDRLGRRPGGLGQGAVQFEPS